MSDQPCALCGQPFPAAQLLTVDGRAVCAGCKPLLLQRVLSGAPEPLLPVGLEMRELGFGEMLGQAAHVLWGEGLRMLPLVAGISLLSSGILALLPNADEETFPGIMMEIGRVGAVDLIVGVFSTLGVVWLVRERREGRRGALGFALAHAARRWLAGVGTGWLESIIVTFFLLLLIVPAIIAAGFFTFSIIIVALSGRSGTEALRYSKLLVAGRWWRVFGYSLAVFLPVVLYGLAAGIAHAVVPQFSLPEWVENLVFAFAELPGVVCMTVLYLHLDAQHRAREAAGGGPGRGSA